MQAVHPTTVHLIQLEATSSPRPWPRTTTILMRNRTKAAIQGIECETMATRYQTTWRMSDTRPMEPEDQELATGKSAATATRYGPPISSGSYID